MQQLNNEQLRKDWKIGSLCEIYSDSRKQWFEGQIIDIYNDEEGQWLKVTYAKVSVKEVQRYSENIRPTLTPKPKKTETEQDAIDTINLKQDIISKKINTSSKDIIRLTNLAKINENNMNEFRKEAIGGLNKRIDEIIEQSHIKIQEKEEMISEYIQQLKSYQKSLIKTDSKINNLLKNYELNKYEKQKQISKIMEHLLQSEEKDIDITVIKADINKENILKFIDNIGTINSYLYPLTPIIYVININPTSATIYFENIKKEYECFVEMKTNYNNNGFDEKEMSEKWKEICCIANVNKYNINNMETDTLYFIRTKYKNKTGFGSYSNTIQIKTRNEDIEIESRILTQDERKSFVKLLFENEKYLGNEWNLIYSSKQEMLNKNIFIDKVYDKINIVVFIQTENGNVCGGYSKTGWNKNGKNGTCTQDNNAFIFGIRSCKNYSPILRNVNINNDQFIHALRYHNDAYCMFGKNGALYIYKNGYVFHNNPITYNSLLRNRQLLGGESKQKITYVEVFQVK